MSKAKLIKQAKLILGDYELTYDKYDDPTERYTYVIYNDYIIRMKPGGLPEISQRLDFEVITQDSTAYKEIMHGRIN